MSNFIMSITLYFENIQTPQKNFFYFLENLVDIIIGFLSMYTMLHLCSKVKCSGTLSKCSRRTINNCLVDHPPVNYLLSSALIGWL